MNPDVTSLFQAATDRIAPWTRPLLITHARPDGDALGSLVAMRSFLRAKGKRAVALLFEPCPERYHLLNHDEPMSVLGRDVQPAGLDEFDGVIVLDTCTYNQLDPIADWLRQSAVPKVAIDHHVTRDDLADVHVVDESAAANCLILHEWARAMNWPIKREAAEALFVGMAMDSGWFHHANTDDRVLAASAELVARGVRPHLLYEELFRRQSSGRVRLLGAAVQSLELTADDRLAVMTLPASAFAELGATQADTEEIIDTPLAISGVVVSVLLVEAEGGIIRASLRSKAPRAAGDPDIDVAAVAGAFGGGGHRRAAGARITGSLRDVRRRVRDHLGKLLGD